MRGEGRQGQHCDDDEARSHCVAYRQPEEQEVKGDKQESATVRQQPGEQPNPGGGRDEERAVPSPNGSPVTVGLCDRPSDTDTDDHEYGARGDEQRPSARDARKHGSSDGPREPSDQRPGRGPRPRFASAQVRDGADDGGGDGGGEGRRDSDEARDPEQYKDRSGHG